MIEENTKIKDRKKRLNNLLSTICTSPYVLEMKKSGDGYIIEPLQNSDNGISLKKASGIFLNFYEKWENISGEYFLSEYIYQIKFLDDIRENNAYRLFGYELHPKIENVDFEHINFLHPKPFFGDIHYYNDFTKIPELSIREHLFEHTVLKTVENQILKKELIADFETYLFK